VEYVALLFLTSLCVSTAATWLGSRWGHHLKMVDHPDGFRKLHQRPIPLVGGIVIYAATTVTIAAFIIYHHYAKLDIPVPRRHLVAFSLSGLVILTLGIVDDLKGTTPRTKILVQSLAAMILILFGFRVDTISNPFGEPIPLGLLTVPVTLSWLLLSTNALNLIDGVDGLAGGIAFIATTAIFVLACLSGNIFMCLLTAAVAGSILGFLFFNLHPASVFLGDSGSMLLGFLYGAIAFRGLQKIETGFVVFVPLIIFGFPLLDTAMAVLRRWLNGFPIFSADRQHLHHRLLDFGIAPGRTTLILYGIAVLLASVGVGIALLDNTTGILLLVTTTALVFVSLRFLWGVLLSNVLCGVTLNRVFMRIKQSLHRRQETIRCWSLLQKTLAHIRRAEDSGAVWGLMKPVFRDLGVAEARMLLTLPLKNGNPSRIDLSWRNEKIPEDQELSRRYSNLGLPIHSNGYYFGQLRLILGKETPSINGWLSMLERLGEGAGVRLTELCNKRTG